MSVFQPGNVAYGLSQALIAVANQPIIAQRAPTTSDRAALGTLWIDEPANAPYILTSIVDNVATWVSANGSGAITSVVTDSGTAIPVLGVLNLFGGANIVTSASGNTVDVAVTPNINLPATNASGTQGLYELGGLRFAYAYPPSNAFLGITAGNTTLNSLLAIHNTGIGNNALESLTTGNSNTAVGAQALTAVTTGLNNVGVGYLSGDSLTTGDTNIAMGNQALQHLITGNDNLAVGFAAGVNYTGAESSNIVIGNQGLLGESNVIRIGSQGSGAGQQDACNIAGIYNTAFGVTNEVVFVDNSGFVGSSTGTDGEVIIGSSSGSPIWATLTAGTDISIVNAANSITISATGGAGIETIDGDSGSATGATVTFNANTNCGSTVQFVASGATVDLEVTNSSVQSTMIGLAAGNSGASGDFNTALGSASCNSLTTGENNCALGSGTLQTCTTGSNNTAIGVSSLTSMAVVSNNVAIGHQSLTTLGGGGGNNTAVGYQALSTSGTGNTNIALGYQAGLNYFGSESSNIVIGNVGTFSESHVIRLGTQGSGTGQQNKFFIAGVNGVTLGGSPDVVTIDTSTGQLGVATFPTSGIATIDGDSGSATGSTVTFNANSNSGQTVRFVASGATVDFEVTDINSNTLFGLQAGHSGVSGTSNTGFGNGALNKITSGSNNTSVGFDTLFDCTTGFDNVAIGSTALEILVDGSENVSVGEGSLTGITSGTNNIAVGFQAGVNYATGTESSNILIGNLGTNGESNVIRIGTQGASAGEQNECFIAGITGVTVSNNAAVLIDTTTGQLGTVISSRRYKENIEDMDAISNNIMNLRPVTFTLKNDPTKERKFGLIAEEVDATFPGLVTYNSAGDPETVRYHDLPALLLNELQKQHNVIAMLQGRIQALENRGRYESTN
jgi:trimeric autotransporter adhesin